MIFYRYLIYKPKYIILVFDYNRKNFRNKIYKEYKNNRKKISYNLLKFINIIKNTFFFWKIKYFNIPDVEGDDVINCLVNKFLYLYKNKYIIYILSYDKDLLQLVTSNVYLLISKNKCFNKKIVLFKYGIGPKLIKDLLILCGDRSDNIPGIKGIGIKTASLLLNKIGNISNIYKNLNKIKFIGIKNYNFVINSLKKNFDNIKLWYSLIKLKNNIRLKINLNDFKINYFFFIKIFDSIKKLNI